MSKLRAVLRVLGSDVDVGGGWGPQILLDCVTGGIVGVDTLDTCYGIFYPNPVLPMPATEVMPGVFRPVRNRPVTQEGDK